MHLDDMRVKKTKRNIRNSFLELIMVKDISKITVKELSEKAEINRKTFYIHYASIYDVMEEIENEIIQKLKSILEKYNYFNNPSNINFLFFAMNDVVKEDYVFYKQMLNSSSYPFFVNKVKVFFKKTLITQYATDSELDEQVLNLYAEYISTGVISMYAEWIQGKTLLTLEEMSEYATNIFWHGTSIIVNK
jgi:AcrR family transcriptional regulator